MADLSPMRIGRITGSRVGKILGLSRYGGPDDVLREMVRQHFGAQPEFVGNAATEWGEAHEADAIAAYERERGGMTHGGQEIIVHPKHDFLAVTPDGLVGDDGMVEAKCPYRSDYTSIMQRAEYYAQVQLQLHVAGRDWCDFVIWRQNQPLIIERIRRVDEWLPNVLPILRTFMDRYHEAIASDEAAAPHLADKTVEIDTAEWKLAVRNYMHAQNEAKAYAELVEHHRATLVELARKTGASRVAGGGIQVVRSQRAGSIKYADAIKALAPDADLSAWQGKSQTVYTIKEAK